MSNEYFGENDYEALKEVAFDTFREYVGLCAVLRAQEPFSRRDLREESFCMGGCRDFQINENEKIFHYIGFMDALVYLNQHNMLNLESLQSNNNDNTDLSDDMGWLKELEDETEKINTAFEQFLNWATNFTHGEQIKLHSLHLMVENPCKMAYNKDTK